MIGRDKQSDPSLEAIKIQLRELSTRQQQSEDRIDEIDRAVSVVSPDIIPQIVNFADNSDFLYDCEAYSGTTFTDDEDTLYGWYVRDQGSALAWEENDETGAGTIAPAHAITKSTFTPAGNYPSFRAYWDTTNGSVNMKGSSVIAHKLSAVRGYAGNQIAVRLQASLKNRAAVSEVETQFTNSGGAILLTTTTAHQYVTGVKGQFTTTGTLPTGLALNTDYYAIRVSATTLKFATSLANAEAGTAIAFTDDGTGTHTFTPSLITPASDLKLKISIWDNTDLAIKEGSDPTISGTKVGTHTGSVTRDYILEVHMQDGSRFYSSSISVTNTDDVDVPSSSKYVNLTWTKIIGSARYKVYRRAGGGDWFMIGSTFDETLRDKGGYFGTGIATMPPSFDSRFKEHQRAETFFDDVGELLQTEDDIQELVVGLYMPTLISTYGDQYLQIEFVNSNYSTPDMSELDMIAIDKVGLSYANGRWVPSARDISLIPTGIVVTPPPSGGGGGGTVGGGGFDGCVEEGTPVLMWNPSGRHYWVYAYEVAVGDYLVAWNGKELAPSRVNKVIDGLSTANLILHLEDGASLKCTWSHSVVTGPDDFATGTGARKAQYLAVYKDGEVKSYPIVGTETQNSLWKVRTFRMDRTKRNFLTWGWIFSHNLKSPIE